MEEQERVKVKKSVWHTIPTQKKKDESYTASSGRHSGVCLGGGWLLEGCFQDRFNVFTEGASEARPG